VVPIIGIPENTVARTVNLAKLWRTRRTSERFSNQLVGSEFACCSPQRTPNAIHTYCRNPVPPGARITVQLLPRQQVLQPRFVCGQKNGTCRYSHRSIELDTSRSSPTFPFLPVFKRWPFRTWAFFTKIEPNVNIL
jgi:hypothetical protein